MQWIRFCLVIMLLGVSFLRSSPAFSATDGIYTLSEGSYVWDGTDADRLKEPTVNYIYGYGDESIITYRLPWPFAFYGQTYDLVNIDTNGNIWFGAPGSGPVIRAWNDDLSSYYYGGVFVQRKTGRGVRERVVIEWQTETYTDEGMFVPNDFEIVLIPNGVIRIDYKSITTSVGKDEGSGIYKGDGVYNDITTNFAPVPTLTTSGPRSFSYVLQTKNLQVNLAGSGLGTITSIPPGLTCATNCYGAFPALTNITLYPTASGYALFTGWTGNGPCSGTGNCSFAISSDTTVTPQFDNDPQHQVRIDTGSTTTYFSTVQAAYDAAASGTTIKLLRTTYTENVNCAGGKTVVFQGGYNGDYTAVTGTSTLKGKLTINSGSGVNVKNFTIIPPAP